MRRSGPVEAQAGGGHAVRERPPVTPAAAPPQLPTGPAVKPLQARRRPALVALAIALIALGGGTGAWLLSSSGDSVQVLTIATEVSRGEVITATDLTSTELPAATVNLDTVPASDIEEVVGQVATTDLLPGSLLTSASFAPELRPAPGSSVVGVLLSPAQMPGLSLAGGERVRFVATPQQGGELPAAVPTAIEAEIINVQSTDAGSLVNVQVPSAQAPLLAAMAATTRIALVLDPGTE